MYGATGRARRLIMDCARIDLPYLCGSGEIWKVGSICGNGLERRRMG